MSRRSAGASLATPTAVRWLPILALAACAAEPVGEIEAGVSCEVEEVTAVSAPQAALDVVIAIADTRPMAAYADRIREELARFVNVLESLGGGLPSVRVAVVADDSGGFWTPPTCVSPYIVDTDRPWFACDGARDCRDRNYTGTLADAVACLGAIEATADAAPPILDRVVRAIRDDTFLRDDAYLAVLVISNHDDPSPEASFGYLEALRPGRFVLGVVAPDPAPRLDALPGRVTRASFDADDWSGAIPFGGAIVCGPAPGCIERAEGCVGDVPPCVMATPDRPAADTPLPCWWTRETGSPDCSVEAVVERATHGYEVATLRCPC